MKAALYSLALFAALTACVRKDNAVPTSNPNVEKVSETPRGAEVYRHCISGVSYLTFDTNSVIAELDEDGKPRECRVQQ